jgi:hypothetical protein
MYKHLQERYAPRPPVNVAALVRMKAEGEKIACITAYDASFATLVDDTGIGARRRFAGHGDPWVTTPRCRSPCRTMFRPRYSRYSRDLLLSAATESS